MNQKGPFHVLRCFCTWFCSNDTSAPALARGSDSPTWLYDKAELRKTPSFGDGIVYETECRYRREGARFIIKVGLKMNLRYDTMATGVVYFHRFYMCHSFKTFPRFVTAACCLFLAGKVEETPKKCKDIIKIGRAFLTDAQFLTFGEDPKENVLTMERILLQTVNFDLQVDHPYSYLLKYAKALKGDQEVLQKMVQMAWTFINDSLCTTICLQWESEIVAIALMFLAGKLSKFEVLDWQGRLPKHKKWWDLYVENITLDLLEDICHQVLDLYSMPMQDTPQDSPPASPATGVVGTPIQVLGAPIPSLGNRPMNQGTTMAGPPGFGGPRAAPYRYPVQNFPGHESSGPPQPLIGAPIPTVGAPVPSMSHRPTAPTTPIGHGGLPLGHPLGGPAFAPRNAAPFRHFPPQNFPGQGGPPAPPNNAPLPPPPPPPPMPPSMDRMGGGPGVGPGGPPGGQWDPYFSYFRYN